MVQKAKCSYPESLTCLGLNLHSSPELTFCKSIAKFSSTSLLKARIYPQEQPPNPPVALLYFQVALKPTSFLHLALIESGGGGGGGGFSGSRQVAIAWLSWQHLDGQRLSIKFDSLHKTIQQVVGVVILSLTKRRLQREGERESTGVRPGNGGCSLIVRSGSHLHHPLTIC